LSAPNVDASVPLLVDVSFDPPDCGRSEPEVWLPVAGVVELVEAGALGAAGVPCGELDGAVAAGVELAGAVDC